MKKIFAKLQIITFGIVFAVGLSYLHAAPWTRPSTTPVGGNMPIPIHTETGTQVKISDANGNGGLSVNGFSAYADALFAQDIFFNSILQGGNVGDTISTLSVGDTSKNVNALVNGFYKSEKDITVTTLATNGAERTLCADTNGNVVWCDTVPPPPTSSPVINSASATFSFLSGASVGVQCWATLDAPAVVYSVGQVQFDAVVSGIRRTRTCDMEFWPGNTTSAQVENSDNVAAEGNADIENVCVPATSGIPSIPSLRC